MRKYIITSLPLALALLLAVTACEDDKDDAAPTTVTLTGGGVSTEFNNFIYVSTSYSGIDALIITGATASDTLIIISSTSPQTGTDIPISLGIPLGVIVSGTLGGGQITALVDPGSTGSLTFTRMDIPGIVSGEFSDDATLIGLDASPASIVVTISGGFSAFGGGLPGMSILPERVQTLLRSVEGL